MSNSLNSILNIREQVSSSDFDISNYFEPQLRACIRSADLEPIIVNTFETIAQNVNMASNEIESSVASLEKKLSAYNSKLSNQLDKYQSNLTDVTKKLENLYSHFSDANDGAFKIGEKLSMAEHQRIRVCNAIAIMGTIQELEHIFPEGFNEMNNYQSEEKIRELLPKSLQNSNWDSISKMLFDLSQVLQDINCEELHSAKENILRLSQIVENQLLLQFEEILKRILTRLENENENENENEYDTANDPDSIHMQNEEDVMLAKELVNWLYYFNSGKATQELYMSIVIKSRVEIYKIIDPYLLGSVNQSLADFVVSNTVNTLKDTAGVVAGRVGQGFELGRQGLGFVIDAVDLVTGTVITEVISRGQDAVDRIDGVIKLIGKDSSGAAQGDHEDSHKDGNNDNDNDNDNDGGGDDDGDDGSSESGDTFASRGESVNNNNNNNNNENLASDANNNLSGNNNNAENQLVGGEFFPGIIVTIPPSEMLDKLSDLFNSISLIAKEQFYIISKIFDKNTALRLIRQLIGIFFKDPTFGLDKMIAMIFDPQPPNSATTLSPSEYLDALHSVREKLSGLYLILFDYSKEAMESVSNEIKLFSHNTQTSSFQKDQKSFVNDSDYLDKSVNELKILLENNTSHVLDALIGDYFVREINYLKEAYHNTLNCLDDKELTKKVPYGSIPRLNGGRFRSIDQINKTIGSASFISRILAITTDSVQRAVSIARDDPKLCWLLRDMYLIHIEFMVEGILLPWSAACNSFILRTPSSSSSFRESSLPPLEFINSLGAMWKAVLAIKNHFDDIFVPPLSMYSHILIACREKRRFYLHKLDIATAQTLNSWTTMIILYLAKLLSRMQTKYDYAPKPLDSRMSTAFGLLEPEHNTTVTTTTTTLGGQQVTIKGSVVHSQHKLAVVCSPACDKVCLALLTVSNCVRANQAELSGLSLEELLWKPLGDELVGLLISHIRRQKITPDGAFVLMKDLEAYYKVGSMLCRPETVDMLSCLKDIGFVFMVHPGKVTKYVLEDLRHLDSSIVVALVRARSDYVTQKFGRHWTRDLSAAFPSFHFDFPLPWEIAKEKKKAALKDSSINIMGPSTIRNASAPLTDSRKLQIIRDVLVKNVVRNQSFDSLKASNSLGNISEKEIAYERAAVSSVNVVEDDTNKNAFEKYLKSNFPKIAGKK